VFRPSQHDVHTTNVGQETNRPRVLCFFLFFAVFFFNFFLFRKVR
jgi:hypothetical protein